MTTLFIAYVSADVIGTLALILIARQSPVFRARLVNVFERLMGYVRPECNREHCDEEDLDDGFDQEEYERA
jgi:hypothetical protein